MIHYKILEIAKELPKGWDQLAANDVLLQSDYLSALETAPPSNVNCYYLLVFKNENLVGVGLIQRVQLYLKDMFRDTEVSCIKSFFKDRLSKILKGNILVVGNLTHTGQHGLYFDNKLISATEFYNQVFKAVIELKSNIKIETSKKIRLVLVKDFFEQDTLENEALFFQRNYHKAGVQPNMVMNIREDWSCNQDYITCMKKKYRDRYKRAKKKLNGVVCKEMDLDSIKQNSSEIHRLYLNVSNNASFNTFVLPEHHFYTYKLFLKEKFKVFGYYLNNKLVGFFSLILNNDQLETYFLGYDKEHQYPKQLYLNMLYEMVCFGVENKFSNIVFARTAMEIKSSVGAKARPMVMYLRHTNDLINAVLKPLFRFMNPSGEWEERHPFN